MHEILSGPLRYETAQDVESMWETTAGLCFGFRMDLQWVRKCRRFAEGTLASWLRHEKFRRPHWLRGLFYANRRFE